MSERYVVDLHEVDETRVADVGGKGAQLGALSRIDGIEVPPGFCVTTAAFRRVMADAGDPIEALLDRLSDVDDREASVAIRRAIEEAPVPREIVAAIEAATKDGRPYAVRSSATAEDRPTASFAGQQDTYLNVTGTAEVVRHVRRCWASLFTERAVSYRRRGGVDERTVRMAVVVQEMVFPRVSGILFTADPVGGNRRVATVEAGFGLGEALVGGLVDPDVYRIRDGAIVERTVGRKQREIVADPDGGTRERAVPEDRRGVPALTDEQAVRLVALGRRVEAHAGRPQDIEWCLDGDGFRFVQTRPITTLFPVPDNPDGENRVYLSVGHQQMMTDAMKPLGRSFWRMTTPAPVVEAGGRLFVDATARLASPAGRAALLDMIGKGDPLSGDALRTVVERAGFLRTVPDVGTPPAAGGEPEPIPVDPEIVTELIEKTEASIAAAARELAARSGPELLAFIREDLRQGLRPLLFDRRGHQVFMSAMEATWWLNERLEEWLGEKNAADVLTRSVPNNVTSQMGLDLLDVADALRPYAGELERGEKVPSKALDGWLARYGMRCVGEIDITRPRWAEEPSTLVPLILGDIRGFAPGESRRRFERGRQEAWAKERELLERLREQPGGDARAEEVERAISRVRTYIGYREYPKYAMISRYFLYKKALMTEAVRLSADHVIGEPEDVFHLTFDELEDAVRTRSADRELIERRREEFGWQETLTPPRVLTSEGECLNGTYAGGEAPDGALTGLAVSAGTVEGRARVVLDLAEADLEPGDILVTTHTDPSWTPLFVAVAGLVTEVGGVMTHGAVIAREYGLPAVVGVPDATRLIRDGRRIRVHGTEGYVEMLP